MSTDAIATWDAVAGTFDQGADHGLRDPAVRAAWRELLLGVLPAPPARVADLGCGTGTLSLLLAEAGYAVDGVDFSPAMVASARTKTSGRYDVTILQADAGAPPLDVGTYDAVLCRHVLWTLPDPVDALRRWVDLLTPGGRLVLVEGSWSTGAGLTAGETGALLAQIGRVGAVQRLGEAAYWGREITDERYLIIARHRVPPPEVIRMASIASDPDDVAQEPGWTTAGSRMSSASLRSSPVRSPRA